MNDVTAVSPGGARGSVARRVRIVRAPAEQSSPQCAISIYRPAITAGLCLCFCLSEVLVAGVEPNAVLGAIAAAGDAVGARDGAKSQAATPATPADSGAVAVAASGLRVDFGRRGALIAGMPLTLRLRAVDANGRVAFGFRASAVLDGVVHHADGRAIRSAELTDGELVLESVRLTDGTLTARVTAADGRQLSLHRDWTVLPGWVSLLPPLVAVVLAIVTRQVLISLFCGLWVGVILWLTVNPFAAALRSLDTYIVGALADPDHASVIIFSLSLGGMVGVITQSGGVRGIVDAVSRWARTPRSGQLTTAGLGVVVFFDDYANSLIVGNTMRPLTDRLRISREKLAFLVDATAAPVATVGVISTWTAYQLSLIREQTVVLERFESEAYLFFLSSIPFSFYSLSALALVFCVAASGRDFGSMRRAEERARSTGELTAPGAQPLFLPDAEVAVASEPGRHWTLAIVPILAVILLTVAGLYWTGLRALDAQAGQATLREIIGASDSFRALLWAAFGGSIVAGTMAVLAGERVRAVTAAWVGGARALVLAAFILLLAWSLGRVTKELGTGAYVLALVDGVVSAGFVPALTFLAAAVISFATGTSYGTMAILIPVLLPLANELTLRAPMDPSTAAGVVQATLAAVLSGAVFGDHCSPISDTTVLSSMAAGSDHVDHVRTQLPYAVLAAAPALAAFLLSGHGLHLAIALPLAMLATIGGFWLLSRPCRVPDV